MARISSRIPAAILVIGLAVLVGCKVNVNDKGESKKVDIETPGGSIHVQSNIDPRDAGLSAYPGARILKEGDDAGSANVNMSAGGYGLKVVALKFETDDASDKVADFYRKDLKQFGAITECKGSIVYKGGRVGKQPECRPDGDNRLNLMVGTEDNFHLVAVKPRGKGSQFEMVYVSTHGDKGTI